MGLRLKAVIQRLTAMAPSLWFEKKNGSSSDPGQSIGATGNLTVERTDPLYSLNEDSIENLSLSSANVKNLNSISAQGHVGLSNLHGRKILRFIRPK